MKKIKVNGTKCLFSEFSEKELVGTLSAPTTLKLGNYQFTFSKIFLESYFEDLFTNTAVIKSGILSKAMKIDIGENTFHISSVAFYKGGASISSVTLVEPIEAKVGNFSLPFTIGNVTFHPDGAVAFGNLAHPYPLDFAGNLLFCNYIQFHDNGKISLISLIKNTVITLYNEEIELAGGEIDKKALHFDSSGGLTGVELSDGRYVRLSLHADDLFK